MTYLLAPSPAATDKKEEVGMPAALQGVGNQGSTEVGPGSRRKGNLDRREAEVAFTGTDPLYFSSAAQDWQRERKRST